jgi:hypothetical protein
MLIRQYTWIQWVVAQACGWSEVWPEVEGALGHVSATRVERVHHASSRWPTLQLLELS